MGPELRKRAEKLRMMRFLAAAMLVAAAAEKERNCLAEAVEDTISSRQLLATDTKSSRRQPDQGIVLGEMMQQNALEFAHGQIFLDPSRHSQDARHLHSVASSVARGIGATVQGHLDSDKVPAHFLLSAESALTAFRGGAMQIRGGIVTLNGWNGRFGNNLNQLGAALVFARYVGARELHIVNPQGIGWKSHADARSIFNLPRVIALPGIVDWRLWDSCKSVDEADARAGTFNWWKIKCGNVPAHIYRRELKKHILPYLSKESKRCINDRATEEKEKTLTVHLRTGDITDPTFPCSMPYKVYDEGRYKKMLIVKAPGDHPCMTSYTNASHHRHRQIQDTCCNDLASDFCTLMKAKSLVVGWSTLPEMVALISTRVQHVYHGGDDWEPHWMKKGIDWCTHADGRIWHKGPTLRQFDFPGYDVWKAFTHDVAGQLSYPAHKIKNKDNVKCAI